MTDLHGWPAIAAFLSRSPSWARLQAKKGPTNKDPLPVTYLNRGPSGARGRPSAGVEALVRWVERRRG